MTYAAQETTWVMPVLTEAGLEVNTSVPIRLDNQFAINWAAGERCPSGLAKHIDVRVHFVRALVANSVLDMT